MRKIIDPGLFSKQVAADTKRGEFNFKNAVILENDVKVDFVFIGDSITDFWEINAYLGGSNKMVINRGIGGDTTEFVLKRFDADVVQLKPKHCILMIGINDAWDLEDDPWTQKKGMDIEDVISRAYCNIYEMIKKAKENNINLILCSILPTNMEFTNKNKERSSYVLEVNKRLKAISNKEELIYVNYYSAFVENGQTYVKDGLTAEGLHPNTKGYNIMIEILRNTLLENDILL